MRIVLCVFLLSASNRKFQYSALEVPVQIFVDVFGVYKFRNGGVAGCAEYSGLVQSEKQTETFTQGFQCGVLVLS